MSPAEVAFLDLDSAERHAGCALDDLVFQAESCLQDANFVRYCPNGRDAAAGLRYFHSYREGDD
jgi:hypothetical protein